MAVSPRPSLPLQSPKAERRMGAWSERAKGRAGEEMGSLAAEWVLLICTNGEREHLRQSRAQVAELLVKIPRMWSRWTGGRRPRCPECSHMASELSRFKE